MPPILTKAAHAADLKTLYTADLLWDPPADAAPTPRTGQSDPAQVGVHRRPDHRQVSVP